MNSPIKPAECPLCGEPADAKEQSYVDNVLLQLCWDCAEFVRVRAANEG